MSDVDKHTFILTDQSKSKIRLFGSNWLGEVAISGFWIVTIFIIFFVDLSSTKWLVVNVFIALLRFFYYMMGMYYVTNLLEMAYSLICHLGVTFLPLGYNFKTKPFGEWVIITGATAGIGKAFAKEFASYGNKLLLISRNYSKLEDTKTEIQSTYDVEIDILAIDFSKSNQFYLDKLNSKLREVRKDNTRIADDIAVLINNVGYLPYAYDTFTEAIERSRLKEPHKKYSKIMQESININCLSQFTMTAEIYPLILSKSRPGKKGVIISLSSYTGRTACPFWVTYTGCKGFNAAFSDSLSAENKMTTNDVIFTTVHPMEVSTEMAGAKWKNKYPIRCPPAETFVKSVCRQIGVKNKISGWWAHDIRENINRIIGPPGLYIFLWARYHKITMGRNRKLVNSWESIKSKLVEKVSISIKKIQLSISRSIPFSNSNK